MIRVFVVEDEPPALRKVKRLLEAESDLFLCGFASSCAEAITEIRRTLPRLLLLDIHLPDGSGFEVLQGISDLQDVHTVFLTAMDDRALEAFDVSAIDYLVKPVAQERFSRAIQRVRARLQSATVVATPVYTQRFLVERRRLAYLLPVECIDWIGADRNYARLFSSKGEFALRTTMDLLQRQLDPAIFRRVSRSAILRLQAIREIRRRPTGHFTAVFENGAAVPFSKTYWDPSQP